MSEELWKPADVCKRLALPPSTLRIYSAKFGELLSEGARRAGTAEGGGSHRLYNSRDLLLLTRAKELLGQGFTYERALEELRLSMPAARVRPKVEREESGSGKGAEGAGPPDLSLVRETLQTLRSAVDNGERTMAMYRELVVGQAAEINALRERMERLETELERVVSELERLENRRRGFWDRMTGG